MEVIISECHDAACNLALEEYLLGKEGSDPFLFIWQNRKTVVIGRNQNAYYECDVRYAAINNIDIVRRMSGGGAVYHDLGNINYTVYYKDNIDYKKITIEYVVDVLNYLGINAYANGRNDIEIKGRKVSGLAYYMGQGYSYTHGCLLVNTDIDCMETVLNPDVEKIKSKGISSVKSRVINLSDINRNLTVDEVKKALVKKAYLLSKTHSEDEKIDVLIIEPEYLDNVELKGFVQKYKSSEWIYEKKIETKFCMKRRFEWGSCNLNIESDCQTIKSAKILSDSLCTDVFDKIEMQLKNRPLNMLSIRNVFTEIKEYYGIQDEEVVILKDISKMISEEMPIHE
ncbi:lipoate--protein ligase [Butyrivibrio sp. YAB3001]|uniref:lipoate--protein ligase n=1 Tax=Butyrivibrio sp. YAB3001 TaxID=1520812 RepID=UPI0008F61F29|nr:lipoate--protein ligase [Butyrivibrio sp. YAB3001]SFB94427.1 lipoate-protein ligase [Butyrivibrio sp. YAB3001]